MHRKLRYLKTSEEQIEVEITKQLQNKTLKDDEENKMNKTDTGIQTNLPLFLHYRQMYQWLYLQEQQISLC